MRSRYLRTSVPGSLTHWPKRLVWGLRATFIISASLALSPWRW